jgi:hypothetical protein
VASCLPRPSVVRLRAQVSSNVRPHTPQPLAMHRLLNAMALVAASSQAASAEPAKTASWRYFAEFEGSTIKATQFLEYQGGSLETCRALLSLAQGLNPKYQAVANSCGIDLPAPDGSPPPQRPSPKEFYVSYEEPALRPRVLKTFTVYHLSPQQVSASEICQHLIATFHSTQSNVRCHAPKNK